MVRTYFKHLLIVFLLLTSSFSALCCELKSSSLFEAMEAFEKRDMAKAVPLFSSFIGKSVPVAEPFLRNLANKGLIKYEQPFVNDGHQEEAQTSKWYAAAARFHQIQKQIKTKPKVFDTYKKEAKSQEDGPLWYLIGKLQEEAGSKQNAIQCYRESITSKYSDPRAIIALNRLCPQDSEMIGSFSIKLLSLAFTESRAAFPEADALAKISTLLEGKNPRVSKNFMYLAAQFGHLDSQLTWAKSHCSNEAEVLFWMMQAAAQGSLEGLGFSGHFYEQGKGTKRDFNRAFPYLVGAANHPDAKALDFWNVGNMYENGKGIPVNENEALHWYKKAYDAEPTNKEYAYTYGKSLAIIGNFQTALEILALCRGFNDNADYTYAYVLYKLSSHREKSQEAVKLVEEVAAKGHFYSCFALTQFYLNEEIEYESTHLISFLKNAISKSNDSKQKAKAYLYLFGLSIRNRLQSQPLQDEQFELISKAFNYDPTCPEIILPYGRALKERGLYVEALDVFLKIQDLGQTDLSNDIGACYELMAQNEKTPSAALKLRNEALKYYHQAINLKKCQDWPIAAYNIFSIYNKREAGQKIDNEKLLSYLRIAAEAGDEDALLDLGNAYLQGDYGLSIDDNQSAHYYRTAIAKGKQNARYNLLINLTFSGDLSTTAEREDLFLSLNEPLQNLFLNIIQSLASHIEEIESENTQVANEASALTSVFSGSATTLIEPVSSLGEKAEKEIKGDAKKDLSINRPESKTRKEKEIEEENERVQRKFDRFVQKISSLKKGKPEKWRKVETLLTQSMNLLGGDVKQGKSTGSGRRIHLGTLHTGFHQPHQADIKGGALKSLKNMVETALNH